MIKNVISKIELSRRQKISNAMKGRKPVAAILANTGKVCKQSTRDKISKHHKINPPVRHRKNYKHTQQTIEKIRISNTGKVRSVKTKQLLSLSHMNNQNAKGHIKSTESKLKISTAAKGRQSPRKNAILSESTKLKISISNKGKHVSAKTRQLLSVATKKRWQNPVYKKQMIKMLLSTSHVCPNKIEKELNQFLHQSVPTEYKFVGDGEFILGGKCPDFLNVNNQKKLIELYGDYWHKNDNPQDRIDYFKQYGYSTLIVWEHELKDKDTLITKIINFTS